MTIEISEGAGGVVAADVRDTLRAFDQAVLNAARMCVSFIEMVDGAGVPMRQSQATLQSMTTGMSSAVGARGEIVDAVRHMLVIKKNSTVAWSDFGCPTGMDERAPVAVRTVEPTRVDIAA